MDRFKITDSKSRGSTNSRLMPKKKGPSDLLSMLGYKKRKARDMPPAPRAKKPKVAVKKKKPALTRSDSSSSFDSLFEDAEDEESVKEPVQEPPKEKVLTERRRDRMTANALKPIALPLGTIHAAGGLNCIDKEKARQKKVKEDAVNKAFLERATVIRDSGRDPWVGRAPYPGAARRGTSAGSTMATDFTMGTSLATVTATASTAAYSTDSATVTAFAMADLAMVVDGDGIDKENRTLSG